MDPDRPAMKGVPGDDWPGLVEALPAGVIVTDLQGVVLYMNPACEAMFNRRRESLLGVDLGLPTVRPGEPAELDCVRLDRSPGTALMDVREVVWGGAPARLCYFEDITSLRASQKERLRLESEVHHLQRMEGIGRLASGIAHDMNNILAAIMAMAQLDRGQAGAVGRHAELVMEAALRGKSLTTNLLSFTRKQVEGEDWVDLNDLLKREADLLRETTQRRVDITLDLAPGLPTFRGSRAGLSTALMNLCINALDAMPEGGRLALRSGREGEREVYAEVEDTGLGMPPEVLARALEPFYTTKAVGKGTGLGLSVVYGTVRAHGGRVHLTSAPGEGTRVRLVFPQVPHPTVEAVLAEAGPPQSAAPPRRILLVDDDALVRDSIAALLQALGHQVTAVGGGQEALWLIEKGGCWDLMVLDLNMPGLTGQDVLARLRALGNQLPVVLASGHAEEALVQELKNLGRVDFVRKPFEVQEFNRALGVVLPSASVRAQV